MLSEVTSSKHPVLPIGIICGWITHAPEDIPTLCLQSHPSELLPSSECLAAPTPDEIILTSLCENKRPIFTLKAKKQGEWNSPSMVRWETESWIWLSWFLTSALNVSLFSSNNSFKLWQDSDIWTSSPPPRFLSIWVLISHCHHHGSSKRYSELL